jgi:hypothetical protein
MSSGEKGAVMRWVGVHIEAKRGRGRLRDGGASKENMCFFPVKGSRGRRVQSVYTLGEFWVPEIHERGREKRSLATTGALVKRARRRERARAQTFRSVRLDQAHKHEQARAGLAGCRVERV